MGDIVEKKPEVPGIGQSGIVMCPYFRSACLKGGCELWVVLEYEKQSVGRCALAWMPKLHIELRQSVDKLRESINGKKKDADSKG